MDANPTPDIAVIAISLVIRGYDRHHDNGSLAIAALTTPVAQVG